MLGQNLLAILLHELKDAGTEDDTRFQRLVETGAKFALRQCRQHLRVHQHEFGLIKGAHQIFSRREIYARLATNRGVHLREKCCGNLHKTDAAHVNTGEKSGNVSHNSAAEGDEYRVAIGLELDELAGRVSTVERVLRRSPSSISMTSNRAPSAAKESSKSLPQCLRMGAEVTTTKCRAVGRVSRM